MAEYQNKQALIAEIERTAKLFIQEFDGVSEHDKNIIFEGMDRTPAQMIAYQLGWMNLIMSWDKEEQLDKEVITPRSDIKWNKLGVLYESFYKEYGPYSLEQLIDLFNQSVGEIVIWILSFTEDEIFTQDVRKWASSTPSKWPIWKWIHINTVAPFQSFRTKIRKWKKLKGEF